MLATELGEELPEGRRQVVTLRGISTDWTSKETCEVLGIAEIHQRVLLHWARARLPGTSRRIRKRADQCAAADLQTFAHRQAVELATDGLGGASGPGITGDASKRISPPVPAAEHISIRCATRLPPPRE